MAKKVYDSVDEIPKEGEAPETEPLKDTDTLPSEASPAPKSRGSKPKTPKSNKIIGLMGVEHDQGPPGSTHG